MIGNDMQIRPCGGWWEYCDGKCTVCGKWHTWTTDSSTPLRDPQNDRLAANDRRCGLGPMWSSAPTEG